MEGHYDSLPEEPLHSSDGTCQSSQGKEEQHKLIQAAVSSLGDRLDHVCSVDHDQNLNAALYLSPNQSGQADEMSGLQQSCAVDEVLSTSNSTQPVETVTSSLCAASTMSTTQTSSACGTEPTVNLAYLTTTCASDNETSSDISQRSCSDTPPVVKIRRIDRCKMEQDRVAAVKYRSRRKQERLSLAEQQTKVEQENTKLHEQVKSAEEEVAMLKSALREIFAPCNHHSHSTVMQPTASSNLAQSSGISYSQSNCNVMQSVGTSYVSHAMCTSDGTGNVLLHPSGSGNVTQYSGTSAVQHQVCVPSNATVTSNTSEEIVTDGSFGDDMLLDILNTDDDNFTALCDQLFPLL